MVGGVAGWQVVPSYMIPVSLPPDQFSENILFVKTSILPRGLAWNDKIRILIKAYYKQKSVDKYA